MRYSCIALGSSECRHGFQFKAKKHIIRYISSLNHRYNYCFEGLNVM